MNPTDVATTAMSSGGNVFFLLMGAILVFAMHSGFAFLEVGTVRHKNQVNALVKILVDFAISTIAYFFLGYLIAYGVDFLSSAAILNGNEAGDGQSFAPQGRDLVKFFFLLTFAAAIPAIISGGIAERAKFWPQAMATALIVGLIYPFFEGIVWNGNFGIQDWLTTSFGAPFHDFAGSIVVHAVGGWIALGAVMLLGVWALHGLCGFWGGITAGIFGQNALGGLGGVSLISQILGSVSGALYAALAGFAIYGLLKATIGIRLSAEDEQRGADISIHNIGANPEADMVTR